MWQKYRRYRLVDFFTNVSQVKMRLEAGKYRDVEEPLSDLRALVSEQWAYGPLGRENQNTLRRLTEWLEKEVRALPRKPVHM